MTYTPAQYAAVLAAAAAKAAPEAAKVVNRGALEVKKKARATAGGHSNAGKAAAANHINYDMRGPWEAEIGYDKMAGSLGTMNEYGSAGNTPGNDLGRALEAEGPVVERFLAEAVDKCL